MDMAANGISTLTTKQARQIAKLEYAQAKRKGRVITDDPGGVVGTYGTWSDDGTDDDTKNYYRSNNTYDATSLPDTYNGNLPGADDNPNTGGLLPRRPWVSVSEIAAPASIEEAVGGDAIINLQVWYDGADTSTYVPRAEDELGITQWTDKSKFAHNANPDGGSNVRPSYENTQPKNTYGYVEFDGVNDNLYINPFTQISEQANYTIFLAAKLNDASDGQALCGVNQGGLSIRTNGGVFTTATASLVGTTNVSVDTNWHIFALRIDLDNPSGLNADKSLLRIDGHNKTTGANDIQSYTGTAGATTGDNEGFYLGARGSGGSRTAGPTAHAAMFLGEVLMFNYALTDIEVKNIENYLSNKWAI